MWKILLSLDEFQRKRVKILKRIGDFELFWCWVKMPRAEGLSMGYWKRGYSIQGIEF